MSKIETYLMVSHDQVGKFEKMINTYLEKGWDLHGNTTATLRGSTIVYSQAMTKNKETKSGTATAEMI